MLNLGNFKVGDIVKYAEPDDDEENDIFEVIEVHIDSPIPRIHVRLICDLPIIPYSVLSPEYFVLR